ncbi:selenoprotein W-like [Geospiza fortis]|uniref:Selenoprotein W-like n=1 Tax=Geospiza fortis TaxID=48883 RepID=A0A8N5F692_GEOFO|nr:selenoprotein W-like [Geospiza fortis]
MVSRILGTGTEGILGSLSCPPTPQSGQGTPEVTGWFEVTVGGHLVHSKKNGDGFVDSNPKLLKIVAAIESCLA